jgi:hypothetical protein
VLIGFAGPGIVCTTLSAVLGLRFYAFASGPLANAMGIADLNLGPQGIFDGHGINIHALLFIQAAVGVFTGSLARSVITVIAMRAGSSLLAVRRFPTVLAGSLIYGMCMAAGVVGLNVWLREHNLDLSNVGQVAMTLDDGLRVIVMRAIDQLLPQPGSPFGEFVPYWRSIIFVDFGKIETLASRLWDTPAAVHVTQIGNRLGATVVAGTPEFQWITCGSIFLILMAETLLRFRTVMIFKPRGYSQVSPSLATRNVAQMPLRSHLLTPLFDSVCFGLRHFFAISVNVWVLRLALCAFSVIFIIAPMAASHTLLVSFAMRASGASDLFATLTFVMLTSFMFVSAILSAFSVVYDVALYQRLTSCQMMGRSLPSHRVHR